MYCSAVKVQMSMFEYYHLLLFFSDVANYTDELNIIRLESVDAIQSWKSKCTYLISIDATENLL